MASKVVFAVCKTEVNLHEQASIRGRDPRRTGSLKKRGKERVLYGRGEEGVLEGKQIGKEKFTSRLTGLGDLWR